MSTSAEFNTRITEPSNNFESSLFQQIEKSARVIWGTNIDVDELVDSFKKYLASYRPTYYEFRHPYYVNLLRKVFYDIIICIASKYIR